MSRTLARIGLFSVAGLFASAGTALALPAGTCTGNCGTLGANGVVVAPPSGATYDFISTNGGVSLGSKDLNVGAETNGSLFQTSTFAANTGSKLEFDFNFVTSDGAGFADYVWARLLDATLNPVAVLFTARTQPSGNTVPGFGLPAMSATLTPPSTPIIPGGPAWSPLGGSSGACFSTGCGYTGWIHSSYTIAAAGNYILEFGTVNWVDTAFDTGLAFAGTTIDSHPISDQVPEPATLVLLGSGLVGLVVKRRRARK